MHVGNVCPFASEQSSFSAPRRGWKLNDGGYVRIVCCDTRCKVDAMMRRVKDVKSADERGKKGQRTVMRADGVGRGRVGDGGYKHEDDGEGKSNHGELGLVER